MKKYLIILCSLILTPFAARAGQCGPDSQYVEPQYALCSTHAHNIGKGSNPTESEDMANMREAVRLKSILIAQEMKRQYDMLDATMRQFRVQLQKAVLFPGDNTGGSAGGPLSTNTGSSYTSNRNADVVLDGAENCRSFTTVTERLTCLSGNIQAISNYYREIGRVDADIKKQLELDRDMLDDMTVNGVQGTVSTRDCPSNITAANINNCLNEMRDVLTNLNQANRTNNRTGLGTGNN
jgi:hypothetical protein